MDRLFHQSVDRKMDTNLKYFQINNKFFPKLIDSTKSSILKHKYNPKQQFLRMKHMSELMPPKQSNVIFQKPILFQINIENKKSLAAKAQLELNSKILKKYQSNSKQKANLLSSHVSCRKQLNYQYINPQLNQQIFEIPKLQQKFTNVLAKYRSTRSIISIPQNIEDKTILLNQQLIVKTLNNSSINSFRRNKPQKYKKSTTKECYKYYLGPGNNSELIKKIMKKRTDWVQTSQSNSIFNFRWTQLSQNFKYGETLSKNGHKQILNHFDFHWQLSTKSGLLRNLKVLSEKQKKFSLFDITPITFDIDFKSSESCQEQLKRFLHFFLENLPLNKENMKLRKKQDIHKLYLQFFKKIRNVFNLQNYTYEKKSNPYTKLKMNEIYSNGDTYLWLLKPSFLNRGRGIYLFRNLNQLAQILIEYFQLNERIKSPYKLQKTRTKKQNTESQISVNNYCKSQSFVIQKYIERPMLIGKRKFDIRVWVLLNQNFDLYFFKEGYIRTSCEQFDLENKNLYVHLTNNAVQKNSQKYQNYQKGNQLSFDDLQLIFEEQFLKSIKKQQQINSNQNQIKNSDNITEQISDINIQVPIDQIVINTQVLPLKSFRKDIIPQMKRIVCLSFESIKKKMNLDLTKYCFEIFGFDFMIDEKFKLWLIQINTNPCIQESSPILEKLIPRMLDDAFCLTIDRILHSKKQQKMIFSVDKYEDSQNMWQFLQNLKQENKSKVSKNKA